MDIHISPNDGVPIYLQIVTQVKYLVASDRLTPGEELPPIRALAERLQVNPNTVAKAYRELEREGLVLARQGRGTFVSNTLARGSLRHQLSPICSALSIEQTRSRTWMVSSSTLARLILMSPAMTRPLSNTRSRMSTRPCVLEGLTSSGMQSP